MQDMSKSRCGPLLEQVILCLKMWYKLEIATSRDNLRQKDNSTPQVQRGDRRLTELPRPRGCREVKAGRLPGVAVHRRWLVSGFRVFGHGSRSSRVGLAEHTAQCTESIFSVEERF